MCALGIELVVIVAVVTIRILVFTLFIVCFLLLTSLRGGQHGPRRRRLRRGRWWRVHLPRDRLLVRPVHDLHWLRRALLPGPTAVLCNARVSRVPAAAVTVVVVAVLLERAFTRVAGRRLGRRLGVLLGAREDLAGRDDEERVGVVGVDGDVEWVDWVGEAEIQGDLRCFCERDRSLKPPNTRIRISVKGSQTNDVGAYVH